MNLRADAVERLSEESITVVEISGSHLRFYAPSPLLISRASSLISKEPDTIHWIDDFERGAVFWDIGANVGTYTLYAAVQKGVSVLAFEPSGANFHVLSRNIELNSLGHLITAYCLAFSDRSRLGTLNMASPAMGAAISQFGRSGEMSRFWNAQTVPASHGMIGFTIDEFIAQFNPPFPNYLKLDVDGLEPEIIAGARGALRDSRLRSLIVELGIKCDSENHDTITLIEESGFRFVSRGLTQGSGNQLAANYLFQRPLVSKDNQANAKGPKCIAESVQPTK